MSVETQVSADTSPAPLAAAEAARQALGNLALDIVEAYGEVNVLVARDTIVDVLIALRDHVALSSGSACTSASLEPSYVLRALGRSDELAHSSIRFTIGRFTTEEDIDFAVQLLKDKVGKLRELSPLWEMHKDGIDLNSIQWAAH